MRTGFKHSDPGKLLNSPKPYGFLHHFKLVNFSTEAGTISQIRPFKMHSSYLLRSHRRRVWSQEPESANWPSEDRITSETKCP